MPIQRRTEVLSTESTLTSRGQTTVPNPIRKALGLEPSDKIRFHLHADNTVTIERAEPEEAGDPMIERFLAFLEKDAFDNPSRLRSVEADTVARAQALVAGVDVDLDAPLADGDE